MTTLADGISFVAASAGTGSFVYASSRTSYRNLSQAISDGALANGNLVSYLAIDSLNPTQREWGHGTLSGGNTISRTPLGTVNGSTDGGSSPSALNFSVPPIVFLTALAEDFGGGAVFDNGTVSSGTQTINVANGLKQKLTVAGSFTMAFSGWAASGNYSEVEIQLVNGGTSVTWPTVNWLVGDGTSSTTFAAMGVALQSSGTNWVVVWSVDGGTTLWGRAS